ncbi:dihydropteroate synthase [Chloroflexota bacterium]
MNVINKTSMKSTHCGNMEFRWGERTYVMGILNVSPDSFSGDGISNVDTALVRAQQLVTEGADIIDVGGESTRPNSNPISTAEEISRVLPIIKRLADNLPVPLSIDTYKSKVAQEAVRAGARMINDIWGLKHDPKLAQIAAEENVPLIIMQNQRNTSFRDFFPDLIASLRRSIQIALDSGVAWDNIIIDPGIGFGKTLEQNLEIIRRLDELKSLSRPVLVGSSRKSLIGLVLDLPVDQRLEGTAASIAIAIANGADIVRVHDISQMTRVVKMSDAIVRSNPR